MKSDSQSRPELDDELRWDPKLPASSETDEGVTRMSILMCLSDAEVARLRAMEEGPALGEGAEYVDLEKPARGVCRVYATTTHAVRDILPRAAVRAATWTKICALLGTET
jgi:hypothetical protein